MTSRRAFLAAVGGLALCGCANSATVTTAPLAHAPASSAVPTPTPSPTPSVAELPSRESIVARYAGTTAKEWGLEVPGIITRTTAAAAGQGKVALTLDACGGPHGSGYDTALIATLRRLAVPATLMLNARWVSANQSLARELATDPLFEIQSHGNLHLPLSTTGKAAYGIGGLTDVGAVYDEIMTAANALMPITGKPVSFFRPGTAFADEIATAIARDLGQPVIGFSVNGDGGATFSPAQVAGELSVVKGGDVVISHMNQPSGGTAAGFAQALPGLLERGVTFGTLTQLCAGL